METVAEWFASAVIQTLVEQISSYALQQWGSQSGLDDGLERLRVILCKIQPVIDIAERRTQTKSEGLIQLLRELKDAAYDADDLLDEFEYLRIQQEVEGSQSLPPLGKRKQFTDLVYQVSDYLSSPFKKAKGYLTSGDDKPPCCSTSHDTTEARINKIVERLESISAGLNDVLKLAEMDFDCWKQPIPAKKRETTSTMNASDVYGRNEERERVIKFLLESVDESTSSNKNVSVVSIAGIGGIGKTTLAQCVYTDERVEGYFQKRVWICVSDNFDAIRIMREIIVSISDKRPHDLHQVTSLDYLERTVKESLMGKRLLLVLDDVWNDKWKTLLPPLEAGEKGSKVLVTSRLEKIVGLMSMGKKIFLESLASDDYWYLFKKCAFRDENSDEYPKLECIGKRIVKKLKGSPLAAKTMGGLLYMNLDEEHWTNILKSGIWELRQDEDDILPVLRLSYQHLSKHLQRCFAYCSVFPKEHKFVKDDLIHMWMAQGFIPQQGKKRMEDIGKEYFEDLLSRSFFQPFHTYSSVYVMHDLFQDLAVFVSMDESFIIEGDHELEEIPKAVCHLTITTRIERFTELKNLCKFRNLKTLLIFGLQFEFSHVLLHELVKDLKSLRVLVLESYYMKQLPETVGDLIHLRYLNLENTKIRALPKSLSKLYHLQVLITPFACLSSFPEGANNLINLRHLKHWKLTSLQELKTFTVEKKSGHEIRELRDMGELRKLWIDNLENVESEEESLVAKLYDKKDLAELRLEWGSERKGMPDVEEAVLESFKPYSSLKNITIECYLGVKSPTWMKHSLLSRLESIRLINCRVWGVLPPLGQLPYLKVLYMSGMDAVKVIDYTFYGSGDVKGFPSLEELHISTMPNWEEWYGMDDCHLFPRLTKLFICDCPRLGRLLKVGTSAFERNIPHNPSPSAPSSNSQMCMHAKGFRQLVSLKELSLRYCPKLMMPEEGEDGLLPSSLVELFIEDCGDLIKSMQSFSRFVQDLTLLTTLQISPCPWLNSAKALSHLTTVQKLRIGKCEALTSLSGLQDLVCLKTLGIEGCPLGDLMENKLLPSSISKLEIGNCVDLEKSLPGCLQNLASLNELIIQDCSQLTSLPSEKELCHLTALHRLQIRKCIELTSLGGLHALISLKGLLIEECPKLTVVSLPPEEENFLSLNYLTIDNTSLLRVPLIRRSLTSLPTLTFTKCSQLMSCTGEEWLQNLSSLKFLQLHDCKNLRSLPTKLHSLSSLKGMNIYDCPEIQSLPEKGMPKSLETLHIQRSHPVLKKRCEEGGVDWDKIAHIPDVNFF